MLTRNIHKYLHTINLKQRPKKFSEKKKKQFRARKDNEQRANNAQLTPYRLRKTVVSAPARKSFMPTL